MSAGISIDEAAFLERCGTVAVDIAPDDELHRELCIGNGCPGCDFPMLIDGTWLREWHQPHCPLVTGDYGDAPAGAS